MSRWRLPFADGTSPVLAIVEHAPLPLGSSERHCRRTVTTARLRVPVCGLESDLCRWLLGPAPRGANSWIASRTRRLKFALT